MTDDEQIEILQSSSRMEVCEPPASSVAALHAAVERAVLRARRRRSWRLRSVAAASVATTVLSGSSAAFALSGAVIPRPLREAMHTIGLPIDSVTVADARSAESQLAAALRKRDASAVDRSAQLMALRLSKLDPHERDQVDAEAAALLQQADELDADLGVGDTGAAGVTGAPAIGSPSSEPGRPNDENPSEAGATPSVNGGSNDIGPTPGPTGPEAPATPVAGNNTTPPPDEPPQPSPPTTATSGPTSKTSDPAPAGTSPAGG